MPGSEGWFLAPFQGASRKPPPPTGPEPGRGFLTVYHIVCNYSINTGNKQEFFAENILSFGVNSEWRAEAE